jgi:hypothetical protein
MNERVANVQMSWGTLTVRLMDGRIITVLLERSPSA